MSESEGRSPVAPEGWSGPTGQRQSGVAAKDPVLLDERFTSSKEIWRFARREERKARFL